MISREEVARIAALAKLRLGPGELERMTGDLGRILAFVEQIGEVGEPGAGEVERPTPLREDTPVPSIEIEGVRTNAPAFASGHFVVPPVIGGEE